MSAGWRVREYTLLAEHSRDPIAANWIAAHPRHREVMLSLVDPDVYGEDELRAMMFEALAGRRTWHHPRIPELIERFETVHPSGQLTMAIVIEHVRGVSCDRLMQKLQRMPPWTGGRIVERIARVIQEAGVSPAAVLSTIDGLSAIRIDAKGAPHLIPALLPGVEVRMARARVPQQSFSYLSPEAVMGRELTAQSTVFTLGVVLYEMIAGRRPFESETHLATLEAIHTATYPPLSPVAQHAALEGVLRIALSRSPEDRFRDPGAMADALDRLIPPGVDERAIRDLTFRHCDIDTEPNLPAVPEPEHPLLAEIRRDPEQAEPYLVYADLLQARGDPRGELIVVAHRGLIEAQAELLARHPELLGSIGPLFDRPDRTRLIQAFPCSHWMGDLSYGPLSAEWYLGFIRSLRIAIDSDLDPPFGELLQLVEGEESARFLRRLTIGPRDGGATNLDPIYRLLSTARFELTSLYVGDLAEERPATEHSSVTSLCDAFPKLEHLTLRGTSIRLEPLSFPELRELSIYTPSVSRELRGAVYRSTLPKLEKLDLRPG